MKKNDCFSVEITAYTHQGDGVGRAPDGTAVFVPGAAMGDTLSVRAIKVLSNRIIAKIESVFTPSPDRTAVDCPVFPACGGCDFRHISYPAEEALKRDMIESAFARIAKVPIPPLQWHGAPETDGYRNKAVYPVGRDANGRICYGFYRSGSHKIVPCGACRIQPAVFDRIAQTVCRYMEEYGVAPFHEEDGTGVVRSIFIRQGAVSGEVMVCLVCAKRRLPQVEQLAMLLRSAAPRMTSLLLSYQPERTNRLLGNTVFRLWGKDTLQDTLAGNTLSLSPLSFYQINHAQCERLYAEVIRFASLCAPLEELDVLDLFCGVGSISLALARHCRQVVGVETVSAAVENATENAKQNGLDNARFVCADAETTQAVLAELGFSPQLVVVDPPRKGLGNDLCDFLSRSHIPHLIYVSCDPATLARDAAQLVAGGYSVQEISGFDLFPRTANVETAVLFQRQKEAQ